MGARLGATPISPAATDTTWRSIITTAVKSANLGLAFAAEIACYVAVGYWGFTVRGSLPFRCLVGLGVPALMAVAWALFAAPKASYGVHGVARIAFETAWFGLGAAALVLRERIVLAAVFVAAVVVNVVLAQVWHQ